MKRTPSPAQTNGITVYGRQVFNPVDSEEELTKGADDAKMRELEDRLAWALDRLEAVQNETCDRNEALRRWNDVFGTDYFDKFLEEEDEDDADDRLAEVVTTVAPTSPKQWSR